MSKHTKGPWKVSTGYIFGDQENLMRDWNGDNPLICSLFTHISEENTKANAKLIAAAPEMLQVLKETFDILDGVLGDTDPQIDDSWTDEEIRDEYPVFHATQLLIGAIKKAEASE